MMACKLLLVVSLLVCVAYIDAKVCAGCAVDADHTNVDLQAKLNKAVASLNSDVQPKKVTSCKTQVVAGTKYVCQYEASNGKKCTASWVEQVWVSDEPQFVENKCE